MTNGSIRKGKYKDYRGEWVAQPKNLNEPAQVKIVPATINGKCSHSPQLNSGLEKFLIRLPSLRLTEGNVQRSVAAAQQVVSAVLENFEFDLTYTAVRITISVNDKGFDITEVSENNKLTAKQKGLIGNLRAGQKIIY